MGKKFYVVSTLTNDQRYSNMGPGLDPQGKILPKEQGFVVIRGGHGRMDAKNFIVPKGVVTVVDEKQMEILEGCPMFKRHRERKHVEVLQSNPKSVEKVADGMAPKDGSAQLTPDSFDKEPTTGEIKE